MRIRSAMKALGRAVRESEEHRGGARAGAGPLSAAAPPRLTRSLARDLIPLGLFLWQDLGWSRTANLSPGRRVGRTGPLESLEPPGRDDFAGFPCHRQPGARRIGVPAGRAG